MITITSHEVISEENGYRRIRYRVIWDGVPIDVDCEDGQYDYELWRLPVGAEDDEEMQVAIGEYMEAHNIDPGIVHR